VEDLVDGLAGLVAAPDGDGILVRLELEDDGWAARLVTGALWRLPWHDGRVALAPAAQTLTFSTVDTSLAVSAEPTTERQEGEAL